MFTRKSYLTLALLTGLAGGYGLSACDDEPDTLGEAIEDAGDDVENALDDVGDKIDDATDDQQR
jgi:hypothetical protein